MDLHMKFFYQRLVTVAIITGLLSCTHNNHKNWIELPAELAETSGLACLNEQLWTINDSGNAAVVYQVNQRGDIEHRHALAVKNIDWEAITAVDGSLFIGDIGNNAGIRQQFTLYRLENPTSSQPHMTSWQLIYPDQPRTLLPAYDHDFDAEALVALTNTRLLLFTKSWNTDVSHVYQIDLTSPQLIKMQKRADIIGLPGIVTDVALDPKTGNYLVVGYQNYRRNLLEFAFNRQFSPFIATLKPDFTVETSQTLAYDGQVEGVVVCAGKRWFSAEKSDSMPARIWSTSNQ